MHRTLLREELDDEEAKNLGIVKKKEEIDRKKKKLKKAGTDKRDVSKGQKINPAREEMSGSAVNPSAEQTTAQSNLSDSEPTPAPLQQAYKTPQQLPQNLTLAQQAQIHHQQQLLQKQWQIPPPPSRPHTRNVQPSTQYQPHMTPPQQGHYQQHGQFVRTHITSPLPFVLSQGTPQVVTPGVSQGIPLVNSQGVPQGVQQGVPQGISQVVPQGMPQNIPQGTSQGVPQVVQQGVPQGMPPGVSQGMPQGVPQGMSQGMPQSASQGVHQGVQQGLPQGMAQNVPQGVPQGFAHSVPQSSLQGIPQEVQQSGVIVIDNQPGISQSVSHSVTQVMPQGTHISQVPQEIVQQDGEEGTSSPHQQAMRRESDPTLESKGSWASSSGDCDEWDAEKTIHEEQWATFPHSLEDKHESDDDREYAEHSSDEIESSDDETPSGSPVLFGEEGDVLLRAPSLTSFAESTSSVEEESEENPWIIQPEQKDYYTKQFLKLQPIEDGLVKGPKARDFFVKSNLPNEVLSRIWQLSDINKDNALNLDEFCIAMHLVVALRHGLDLPLVLPDVLLPNTDDHIGPDRTAQGIVRQSSVEFNSSQELAVNEDSSIGQPISVRPAETRDDWNRQEEFAASKPRSFSDPSSSDDYQMDVPRKTSLQGGYHVQSALTIHQGHPVTVLPPPGGTQVHSQVLPPILPPPPTVGGLLQCLPQGTNQAGLTQGLLQSPPQVNQGAQMTSNLSQVSQNTFHTQQPEQAISPNSNEKTVSHAISRPRASVKPSLLDAGPEQLLPPPSGKFSREGWTPTKIIHSSHTVTSPPPPLSPIATGPSLSPPPGSSSPTPSTSISPVPQGTGEEKTPPSSPVVKTPTDTPKQSPPQSPAGKVVCRSSKRSGERPRSMGDVKVSSTSNASSNNSQELENTKDKKGTPPPPPPRNKRGHSRSSSLDLNKLFASKAKEKLVVSTSASSSHSIQASIASAPTGGSHPDLPMLSVAAPTPDKTQEGSESTTPTTANFADFSKFDSYIQEQSSTNESQSTSASSSSANKSHRRSMSVDHVSSLEWPGDAVQLSTHPQEVLPRPVAKVQPPNPLPLKVTRRQERMDKDSGSEAEKKLKTNPPKVIVRPLTKEDILNSKIRDLKDKNASLSRVNSEMQQELKEIMEMRASLELKLERLKPCNT